MPIQPVQPVHPVQLVQFAYALLCQLVIWCSPYTLYILLLMDFQDSPCLRKQWAKSPVKFKSKSSFRCCSWKLVKFPSFVGSLRKILKNCLISITAPDTFGSPSSVGIFLSPRHPTRGPKTGNLCFLTFKTERQLNIRSWPHQPDSPDPARSSSTFIHWTGQLTISTVEGLIHYH